MLAAAYLTAFEGFKEQLVRNTHWLRTRFPHTFFFPATVTFLPLRVRAFLLVFWPAARQAADNRVRSAAGGARTSVRPAQGPEASASLAHLAQADPHGGGGRGSRRCPADA